MLQCKVILLTRLLKKCSKKDVSNNVEGHRDKMARTKTNTLNSTTHTEQQDLTDIQNKHPCVVFFSFLFLFYIYKITF